MIRDLLRALTAERLKLSGTLTTRTMLIAPLSVALLKFFISRRQLEHPRSGGNTRVGCRFVAAQSTSRSRLCRPGCRWAAQCCCAPWPDRSFLGSLTPAPNSPTRLVRRALSVWVAAWRIVALHHRISIRWSRFTLAVGSLILAALMSGAYAPRLDRSPLDQQITRIEHGLRHPITIDGETGTMQLADRMKRLGVPGVSVAVIHAGKPEWAKGYGNTTAADGTAVTTETLFQAGSISKLIAAVAAMRLVEQGRLELDSNVDAQLTTGHLSDSLGAPTAARVRANCSVTPRRSACTDSKVTSLARRFHRSFRYSIVSLRPTRPPCASSCSN
jgi:hypothetical protein